MRKGQPLRMIEQAVECQLDNALSDIRDNDGIVTDFHYDQETDDYYDNVGSVAVSQTEREVTLELTYMLPE